MFKRIQSLFIVLALLVSGTLFFAELCYANVPAADGSGSTRVTIHFMEQQQYIVFTFVTCVLCVFTLFYWRKLRMQVRLCTLNILLQIAYQIWILVDFRILKEVYSMSVFALFPAIAVVLLYLAIRFIEKDEMLGYVTELSEKKFNKKKSQRQLHTKRRGLDQ